MQKTQYVTVGKIGLVLCTALLGAVAGCIGYVDGPRQGSAHVEVGVVDDYVYYPGYQVYYSSTRHQYVYQDGRSWVSRPAPPRVSAQVLVGAPSVRLDFHDSPAAHHAAVVRQYPKNWAPPGSSHGNRGGHDQGNQKGREGHN
jgi:hypothetical protein